MKAMSFESMSPGNELAKLLDERVDRVEAYREAGYRLRETEREITHRIMKDPIGFENVISINWRRLYKIFGA